MPMFHRSYIVHKAKDYLPELSVLLHQKLQKQESQDQTHYKLGHHVTYTRTF